MLDRIIFIDSLPKLDLHGLDRESARVAIQDFILDQKKMHQACFVIVHGKGQGILREATDLTLKNNKNVIEYKRYYYNDGATLVAIRCL